MVSKLRVESPKYSLRRTADLRGGVLRFHVWTLTHLVYPSAGGLHSLVDSDREEDVSILREVDLAPSGYASLGGPVGGHLIDSDESGLITKFFR